MGLLVVQVLDAVLDAAQDNRVVHGVASGVMVGDEVVRVAQVVVGKYAGDAGAVN